MCCFAASPEGEGRLRLLTPADEDTFAQLLEGLRRFRYQPPHPLDRRAARWALRRASYLPFGVFYEEQLVGYLLLRLFFPWRAVTAIWSLETAHNRRGRDAGGPARSLKRGPAA